MKKIDMLNDALVPTHSLGQRGFTLIEIMVAIAIMSTISLALIKINESMNKTSKNMNQQLDATQLTARISDLLRNQTACTNTFINETITIGQNAFDLNGAIKDSNDNNVMVFNGTERFGDLTLISGVFRDNTPTPFALFPIPPALPLQIVHPVTSVMTDVREIERFIRITMRKGTNANAAIDANQTVGTSTLFRDFRVKFYVLASNPLSVVACHGTQGQYVEAACDMLDGEIELGDCKNLTIKHLAGEDVAATFTNKVSINSEATASDPESLLHLYGDDDQSNQVRLTLPAASNGMVTGEGNLSIWLSELNEPLRGGIGVNADPSVSGVGRYNTANGQAYISFIGRNNRGMIKFITKDPAGTAYDDAMEVENGTVGIGGPAPNPINNMLRVYGNVRIDTNLTVNSSADIDVDLNVDGASTLVGHVNTNTQLRIGETMTNANPGLCYKGECITSWRVLPAVGGGCSTISSTAPAVADCPGNQVVMSVGVTVSAPPGNVAQITLFCCPLSVR